LPDEIGYKRERGEAAILWLPIIYLLK